MFFEKYNNIFGHDKLKNLYVSDTLVVFYCKIISYTFNVVYYNGSNTGDFGNPLSFMPEPCEAMKREMGRRRTYLFKRHNICKRIISKLEPVASAIERDEYNHKNTQLAQVFKEQVSFAKKELKEIASLEEYGFMHFTNEFYQLRSMGLIFFFTYIMIY
jgi:hypothetical protein